MLGTLLGMGTAVLRERRAELDRAFAEDGAAAMQASPEAATWRCDPIPFLFTETEFASLTAGLTQRARLLEHILADIYGPQTLLARGLLPPALVYASHDYFAQLRAAPPNRHLHLYAADLVRRQDGRWCVLADRTAEPSGLGYVIENRRMMARVLPELFKSLEVSPVRPFFDLWQDALVRLAPEDAVSPGLALLTPGHRDPRWFEHVVLARELGCALVEDGDLTVRDGCLWLKTLRGLERVHVLLRRQGGRSIDPLELDGSSFEGVPGLLCVLREGATQMLNGAGAGWAQAPGLAAYMQTLATELLGETLTLPDIETLHLADDAARAIFEKRPDTWLVRSATDPDTPPIRPDPGLLARIAQRPWAYTAIVPPVPAFAPCAGEGDVLEPRSVVVRLFLVFDGFAWRPLQGGLARVLEQGDKLIGSLPRTALSKDVWVLQDEGCDIMGPEHHEHAALPIRRIAGDLPSRVADNFFWLGRYLERLESAARLSRFVLGRLSRGAMLPRDVPDMAIICACLVDAGIIEAEQATGTAPGALTELLLRALARDTGIIARQTGRVQDLTATLRDRLSGEMHASIIHALRRLKGFRLALRAGRQQASIGLMSDFCGQVLEFCAIVAGYAAENMVRGGGHLFLDLGRRIERAQAVALQIAHTLDQPPPRIEAGLALALELCDSALTYRARYLTVLQAAPVLDLVIADEGNPRGLRYQLTKACEVLTVLAPERPGAEDATRLAGPVEAAIAEVKAMMASVAGSADPALAAAGLVAPLQAIASAMGTLSDAVTRRYFALLPSTRTEGWSEAQDSADDLALTPAEAS
jgi:uncharacterized circularly permuted ATP-grasp superfamily protein/uncharacterized alpha-E superfamily protein